MNACERGNDAVVDPKATGCYEWTITEFGRLTHKQFSKEFEIGGFKWLMTCFPRQNAEPWRYVSLFLEYRKAAHTPSNLSPKSNFKLIIKNHKDSSKDFFKVCEYTFTANELDWGFSKMMPLADLNNGSGFLRGDGALVIRVEMTIFNARQITSTDITDAVGVAADFLALLDNPGPTSDFTLIAVRSAGGSDGAASSGDGGSASGSGGSSGSSGSCNGTPSTRSFPVHRAVLAARCPYFRTLFCSAFNDAASRELRMPDTDPDALALLLRYMYGGVLLGACHSRFLLRAGIVLADRLLLAKASELLRERLIESTDATTIVEDMLWATEQAGQAEALSQLEARYLQLAGSVGVEDVGQLAGRCPALLVRLHLALAGAKSAAPTAVAAMVE